MIVDLDGTLVDVREARVSPFDGAYQYGDGLFDTLRAYQGHLYLIDEHLARMRQQAELLQLEFNPSPEHWSTRIRDLLEANDLMDVDARVRIQISRGGDVDTDHTITTPDALTPVTFAFARPVSERVAEQQADGIRVMSLQSAFARGNFPQVKSLNYLPSLMALRFVRQAGFDEAILLNPQKRVLEAATSNVFAIDGNVLRTPSPRLGLLPGITRAAVLALAPELGLRVDEVVGELRDLLLADEVFLTGSVKEIVPVVAVDQSSIGSGLPGPWTSRIQERYREGVERARAAGL